MLFSRSLVALILTVVVLGAPTFKRDVSEVKSDIAKVTTNVDLLDKDIKAFPSSGGSLEAAYKIHEDAVNVTGSLQSATNDVSDTGDFTDADATSIEDKVSNLVDNVVTACNDLIAKKAGMAKDGVQAIALGDLQNLKDETDQFWAELKKKIPASYQNSFKQEYVKATNALDSAIKAYSS